MGNLIEHLASIVDARERGESTGADELAGGVGGLYGASGHGLASAELCWCIDQFAV